jgi:sugar phosphate isomerase/epimerase
MQTARPRRDFLRTACGAAAGALALQLGAGQPLGLMDTPQALAIEPPVRELPARFKFSLAAYSYRNLLKGKDASLTLSDFITDCARLGLEGTELTSYYFPTPVKPEYLRQLKRECFRQGLDVSGTAVGNDFGSTDPDKRRQQIEHVKQWCDYSEILSAPVIRVFAGHVPAGASPEEAHGRMVEGLQECCEYAGQRGVHLALENHGGPTATADGLLRLVNDVDSPWFGVNLDTGNFHTDDIYGDLRRVAPYAINVQVKVTVSGPDKKSRPADLPRLAAMLRETRYRGYVVLEYEESGDPRQECGKYMTELRDAFGTG